MPDTKSEIFRTKGKLTATYFEKFNIKLVSLHFITLNKDEVQELINWLLSKHDEMSDYGKI